MRKTILFLSLAALGFSSFANEDKDKNKKPKKPSVTTTSSVGQTQGQGQSSVNVNTAGGGSSTSSATGGSAASSTDNANNAVQSVTVQGAGRGPVASAYAPPIMPTAVCALGASGGAQGAAFGFSFGSSYIDKNCELLEQVRRASEIGLRDVAAEMMMDLPAFAAATKRIADRGKPAAAAPVAEQYTDPIIRSRLGLPPLW